MAVEFKRLEPEQWQLLKDLRLRSVTDSPAEMGETRAKLEARANDDYWRKQAREYFDDPNKAILVLRFDGAPHGTIYVHVQLPETLPAVAWLAVMWLDPKLRGRGLGGELLNAAMNWAKNRGAKCADLSVVETNVTAIRFYEPQGSRRRERHRLVIGECGGRLPEFGCRRARDTVSNTSPLRTAISNTPEIIAAED